MTRPTDLTAYILMLEKGAPLSRHFHIAGAHAQVTVAAPAPLLTSRYGYYIVNAVGKKYCGTSAAISGSWGRHELKS